MRIVIPSSRLESYIVEHSGYFTANDGTDIWYGTTGDGPPIVLCDGLACDGFIWPYLIDHLVDDFQIVRWHYPAHGRSDLPDGFDSLTIERFSRDLVGVIDALGLDEVVLAGHSMGVQVIFEHYGLAPDRVEGLIPICGSYKEPLDTFHNSDALRRALPYLRQIVDTAPEATQAVWQRAVPSKLSHLVATLAETNPKLMRARDIEPYLDHASKMNVDAFVSLLENIADHSAEDLLTNVEVPTLVVAGEQDTFTPLFRSEEMAERIRESDLIVVPGGTHVGPLEAPELLNSSVEDFLRNVYDMQPT